MKTLLLTLCTILVGLTSTSQENTVFRTFEIVNQTPDTLKIAIGIKVDGQIQTHGWKCIAPTEAELIIENYSENELFWFAEAKNRLIDFAGDTLLCSCRDQNWIKKNAHKRCLQQDWRKFNRYKYDSLQVFASVAVSEFRFCDGDCDNGFGTLILPFNERYVGTFKDSLFHGSNSTMLLADETRMKGDWVVGKKHGEFTINYSNGDFQECVFLNDSLHGEVRYYYNTPDSSLYQEFEIMDYRNGQKHGIHRVQYWDFDTSPPKSNNQSVTYWWQGEQVSYMDYTENLKLERLENKNLTQEKVSFIEKRRQKRDKQRRMKKYSFN